jgi:LDH2 family malate/lactate/ureidoglycolate dehydrogenase
MNEDMMIMHLTDHGVSEERAERIADLLSMSQRHHTPDSKSGPSRQEIALDIALTRYALGIIEQAAVLNITLPMYR